MVGLVRPSSEPGALRAVSRRTYQRRLTERRRLAAVAIARFLRWAVRPRPETLSELQEPETLAELRREALRWEIADDRDR